MIDEIEERLDDAFIRLKEIKDKIGKIKEEMNDSGIPNNRNEITKWMIPVAIGRLDEDVPGEREPIHRFVRAYFSK